MKPIARREVTDNAQTRAVTRGAALRAQEKNAFLPAKVYTIGQAAKMLGVSQTYLRRLEKDGKLVALRTEGNHRRYSAAELRRLLLQTRTATILHTKEAVAYIRVPYPEFSSAAERDLDRQKKAIFDYANKHGRDLRLLLDRVFVDYAAPTERAEQHAFVDMLTEVSKAEVSTLLVASRRRLGSADMGATEALLKALGKNVIETDADEPVSRTEIEMDFESMLSWLFVKVLDVPIDRGEGALVYRELIRSFQDYVRSLETAR